VTVTPGRQNDPHDPAEPVAEPVTATGPYHEGRGDGMSAEDLERYETEIELQLYQEYRAVLPMFKYVVETERRFYLANDYQMEAKGDGPRTYFEISLGDAWVWDMYRPARFVSSVRVVTFKDVNVEELPEKEL
jgi:hypothetical protein